MVTNNFYQCSIEELLETLLKIEKDCFLVEKAQIRYKEYDVCYSYGSLKIYTYDLPAFEESECYLVLVVMHVVYMKGYFIH